MLIEIYFSWHTMNCAHHIFSEGSSLASALDFRCVFMQVALRSRRSVAVHAAADKTVVIGLAADSGKNCEPTTQGFRKGEAILAFAFEMQRGCTVPESRACGLLVGSAALVVLGSDICVPDGPANCHAHGGM